MIYGLGVLFFALLLYGPSVWVRWVMWRYSREIDDMPGTGGELAIHLVAILGLNGVKVESGGQGQNYYSPDEKRICLSPELYHGKSLTAIAVAVHEVGHAIQFVRDEPVSRLRKKYLGTAFLIKRVGAAILLVSPLVFALLKLPHVLLFSLLVGIATLIASAFMYVAILPEEYDASFNKALPILKQGYIPKQHIPAVTSILRAAALTYFAAALADSIRLWRLLRFIR